MKLLFRIAETPADYLIVVATNAGHAVALPYCHTETEFDDGRCFSATVQNGVRWIDPIDTRKGWTAVGVPMLDTPELRAYADSLVGKPYDLIAAILPAFHLSFGVLPAHAFCSRMAALLLLAAGFDCPPAPSPNDLFRWCQEKGYVP